MNKIKKILLLISLILSVVTSGYVQTTNDAEEFKNTHFTCDILLSNDIKFTLESVRKTEYLKLIETSRDSMWVKVLDPFSNRKYWLRYKNTEDLLKLRDKGFKVLKTRRKRVWRSKLKSFLNDIEILWEKFIKWGVEKLFTDNKATDFSNDL